MSYLSTKSEVAGYRLLQPLTDKNNVWKATKSDGETAEEAAIKIFDLSDPFAKDSWETFYKQAEAITSIRSLNVVDILSYGTDTDKAGQVGYIVMPWLPGPTLRELLKAQHKLGPRHAARIARGVAAGLSHAHAKGVYHNDLKPENILLDPDEKAHATIIDFGLIDHGYPSSAPTANRQNQVRPGTLWYMSPETIRGDYTNKQGDIFSLGTVLYEMLEGRVPFTGPEKAVWEKIETRYTLDFSHEVPDELRRIVEKCHERNPRVRYENAKRVVSDLDAFSSPRRKSRSRFPFFAEYGWVLVIVAMLVGLPLTVWLWIISVQLAKTAERYENLVGLERTKSIGSFPDTFEDIIDRITEAEEKLWVATDHLVYGIVSAPEQFEDYFKALKEKVLRADVEVRIVYLDEEQIAREVKEQFSDNFDRLTQSDTWETFVSYWSKHGELDADEVSDWDVDQFVGWIRNQTRKYEEILAGAYRAREKNMNDFVDGSREELPLFLWVVDDREMVFAIESDAEGKEREWTFTTVEPRLRNKLIGLVDFGVAGQAMATRDTPRGG